MNFLYIVCTGRSGGTLLMGILNSIPGYKILGENANAVYQLFAYHSKLKAAIINSEGMTRNWNLHNAENPWWNDLTIQQSNDLVKELLWKQGNPRKDTETIGFKEIRYNMPYLTNYLNWLHDVTNCRFILHTRDAEKICRSRQRVGWTKNHNQHKCIKNVKQWEFKMHDHIQRHQDKQKWFHTTHEGITNGDDIEMLFNWLQVPYDKEKIDEVLKTKHSY